MADRSTETKPKAAPRVFLATVALGAGLAACKEIGVKSGDSGTIVKATNCWQYPGGKDAGRIEAPLGQVDNGLIRQGAGVTIEAQENDPFGPTSRPYRMWSDFAGLHQEIFLQQKNKPAF